MIYNNNVITYKTKNNYFVITHKQPIQNKRKTFFMNGVFRLITSVLGKIFKSSYNVITSCYFAFETFITPLKQKHFYNVITNHPICYHFVITSCSGVLFAVFFICPVQALSIKQPVAEASFVYGQAALDERVFFQDKEIKKDSDGYFVLALPQDCADKLALKTVQQGKERFWEIPIIRRSWREEVVNGLPPQKVSLSPENQKRIAVEKNLILKGRSDTTYNVLPFCFSRPVTSQARLSSLFGSRRILNGLKTAGHSGTDYAMPVGTPIYAPADGMIKGAYPDLFLTGNTVLIDHGFGLYSSYSHMNEITVRPNQSIHRGEQIGTIGQTGRATGPHLHLVFTWFGTRVDPEYVLTHFACQDKP